MELFGQTHPLTPQLFTDGSWLDCTVHWSHSFLSDDKQEPHESTCGDVCGIPQHIGYAVVHVFRWALGGSLHLSLIYSSRANVARHPSTQISRCYAV